MDRTPVSSSNVASVGYDPDTLTLEVEYLSGATYQYTGVPQNVYDELMSSSSVGSYLARNVKNLYPCSRL